MAYLASRGWTIEAHRFRLGHRELDVVARRGALVAFVEVKTRSSAAWGTPRKACCWRKRRTITQVAEVWRRAARPGRETASGSTWWRCGWRRGAGIGVEHLEDAWRASGLAVE